MHANPFVSTTRPARRLGRLCAGPLAGLALIGAAVPTAGAAAWLAADPAHQSPPALAFATVVGSDDQERHAGLLVDSIRRFGGRYARSPVYVAVQDRERWPCRRAVDRGATLVAFEADPVGGRMPFSLKVYAAATIERRVARETTTLVWLDPDTLVLAPPAALDLGASGAAVVAQSVFLVNAVGSPVDAPPDPFWTRIYAETRLDWRTVPRVETVVDRTPIRYYLNCQAMAVRPDLGLFGTWARLFTALVHDRDFVTQAVNDVPHQIFLHQAVLSAVILAATEPGQRRELPPDHGYPLGLHDRIDPARRVARLDQVSVLIVETAWQEHPDWPTRLPASGALGEWIASAARELLRVNDRIIREESPIARDSSLVTADASRMIGDPGLTTRPGSVLARRSPPASR